jgi:hypothetical protein
MTECDCGIRAGYRGAHSCSRELKPIRVCKGKDVVFHYNFQCAEEKICGKVVR